MKRSGMLVILFKGCKSRILVSLKMFTTKRHYFKLSKCLLGCTRKNKSEKTSYFRFWAYFCRSL